MLPIVSIVVGLAIAISFSIWLWYMLRKPRQWAQFTDKDHDFWVERGLPVKWVGACKEFEQGRGLKVLVAVCIIFAVVLTGAPFVLPFLFPHHH